ncbi:hypothetical protein WJX74_003071 [Apatococcus lobatus]|uniref:histidine kinase n=1 Tax=Apatococcus lobatus TaxID=904363 RepID=A0AAW1QXR6_9CHLO
MHGRRGLSLLYGAADSFLPVFATWAGLQASEEHFDEVPHLLYQLSCAAFASSFFHNVTSLLYETTSLKKKLAALQCFIKGISFICDMQLGFGGSNVFATSHGSSLIPLRYVQWACTCPVMTLLCSWISNASSMQVACAMLASICTPTIGLLSAIAPSPLKWVLFCAAICSHAFVMASLNKMIRSAEDECVEAEARNGLKMIRCSTHLTWNVFPTTFVLLQKNLISTFTYELCVLVSNFGSKIIFSSSVMYANFLTISQRRAIAHELEEQAARIQMIQDLKRAVEVKAEFLSVVSHELRTPLNGIIGLTDAMLGPGTWQLGDQGQKLMKTIKSSSMHLSALINDILDAAAAGKGKLAIKLEKAHLDKLVCEVLDTASQLVKPRVVIKRRFDSRTPAITADTRRLTQILYNLIGNAVKFTSKGSIIVDVRPDPNGSEGDSSTTRKYGGTGLGLNIVQRLVAAHGGRITLDSNVGKGSTFTLFLPIHQPLEETCTAASGRNSAESARMSFDMARASIDVGSRRSRLSVADQDIPDNQIDNAKEQSSAALTQLVAKRVETAGVCTLADGSADLRHIKPTHSEVHGKVLILSVDDEATNHMVLEEAIRCLGYSMHQELDAREALTWIGDQPELPDLILLDCRMPGMSGNEFCKEVRQTVPQSLVPIIMVSAESSETNIVAGLQSGCNDFISKPIKRKELLARIDVHLRLKADASWVHGLMSGSTANDAEAMEILKSILPERIIHRLQEGQRIIGDSHPHVVILFSDIVGFSTMATEMPAVEVFMMLTNLYTAFDRLVDKYSVYKVETIGDGYMIAAGHDEDSKSAEKGRPIARMLKMAQGMLEAVKHFKLSSGAQLQIRVGIHSGPVFAGVIGSKCPRYCFLGDTVNTASRMESTSFPMAVQLSAAAMKDAGAPDRFAALGERSIKGKGRMSTFLFKASTAHGLQHGLHVGEWEAAKRCQEANAEEETQPAAASRTAPHMAEQTLQINEQLQGLRETLMAEQVELQTPAMSLAAYGKPSQAGLWSGSSTLELPKTRPQQLLPASKADLSRDEPLSSSPALASPTDQVHQRGLDSCSAGLRSSELHKQVPRGQQPQHSLQMALAVPLPERSFQMTATSGSSMVAQPFTIHQASPHQGVVVAVGYNVRHLLQSVELEAYGMLFDNQNVTMDALLNMTLADLDEMGIRSLGHRKSILQALQGYVKMFLRNVEVAADPSRSTLL